MIIRGARQTGKTWLMKELGRQVFAETVYINFENEPRFKNLFETDYNVSRIISALELYHGKRISAKDALIIFDEIQEAKGGVTSLKYFAEDAPQYNVIAAGSLLGLSLHDDRSFPVGKVSFLDLHPLSFAEFLLANGKELLLQTMYNSDWDILTPFHQELVSLLKTYLYVGGMPEVVQKWISTQDYYAVRQIQQDILRSYRADFSKHAPNAQVPRLNMVWDSLPAQLDKENKKFVYGDMREAARAKDCELAIMWLYDCGLVLRSHRVSAPRMPLKAYQDMAVFKLFAVDVGLLGAMAGLDARTLIDGNNIFTEYKGAMTEQFVMQELTSMLPDYIGYWTNERSSAEVDFVLQQDSEIIPIEVKAGENMYARSFTAFCQKYNPGHAIKASLLPYHSGSTIHNIPLYGLTPYLFCLNKNSRITE